MQYLKFALNILMMLFSLMVFTLICRTIATFIGEKIGFAKFLKHMWQKLKR